MMKESTTKAKYFEAIGRRKTSTARVRLHPTDGSKYGYMVNGRDLKIYFPTGELRHLVTEPMEANSNAISKSKFNVTAVVTGGGVHSQAEAVRHGISRALIVFDEELRKPLKKARMLKRDPRAKERRKFGLKKARKAPQWSKR